MKQNFENSKPTKKLSLTHLMLMTSFYTPFKTSQNIWFCDVFMVIERDQWYEMG